MQKWSYRKARTVYAWIQDQWNKPDRSDYYSMSTANEVRRVLAAKDKAKYKLEDMKIPFERKTNKPKVVKSAEERTAASKARWSRAYGKDFQ